jgi:protein-S-isoprenylcysteine O-methyltransferase Ste14
MDLVPVGARSDKAAKLITHGPYSIVRHPSYTGVILNFLGSITVHVVEGSWVRSTPSMFSMLAFWVLGTPCALVIIVCCISLVARTNEDEMVHRQFGDEWENWKRRVKYKLIPGVY